MPLRGLQPPGAYPYKATLAPRSRQAQPMSTDSEAPPPAGLPRFAEFVTLIALMMA